MSKHPGGRPPKKLEDRKKQRSTYCKDDIYTKIVEYAESKGKSYSEFLIYAALIEMSAISQEKLLKRIAQLILHIDLTHAAVTGRTTVKNRPSYIPHSTVGDHKVKTKEELESELGTGEIDPALAKLNELKTLFEQGKTTPSQILAENTKN